MSLMKKIEERSISAQDAYESVFHALRVLRDIGIIESPDYEALGSAIASRERLDDRAIEKPLLMTRLWADLLDEAHSRDAEECAAHATFVKLRGRNISRAALTLEASLRNLQRSRRIVEEMAWSVLLQIRWAVREPASLAEFLCEFVSAYYVLNYIEFGEIPVSALAPSEAISEYYGGHDLETVMVARTNGVARPRAVECLGRFFITDEELAR